MNQAEITALQQPISHYARVLYCLYLRPIANEITGATGPIKNKVIGQLLSDSHMTFTQGRQINNIISELIDVGLVTINPKTDLSRSIQDQRLVLPLLNIKDDDYEALHGKTISMHLKWLPDESLYNELAAMVGLLAKDYTLEDIGEFIAYWMGRPQTRLTPFQWTQKFVLQRKIAAQRHGTKATSAIVGSQQVETKPNVIVDDKARLLVEKYQPKKSQ